MCLSYEATIWPSPQQAHTKALIRLSIQSPRPCLERERERAHCSGGSGSEWDGKRAACGDAACRQPASASPRRRRRRLRLHPPQGMHSPPLPAPLHLNPSFSSLFSSFISRVRVVCLLRRATVQSIFLVGRTRIASLLS